MDEWMNEIIVCLLHSTDGGAWLVGFTALPSVLHPLYVLIYTFCFSVESFKCFMPVPYTPARFYFNFEFTSWPTLQHEPCVQMRFHLNFEWL
jgi:hypothetical protein